MEFRKLIKFGNATYCISLPKHWVKNHNLKKGDIIYVEETSNGQLEIRPDRTGTKQEPKEITIEIDGKAMEEVKRDVIVAYINDYTIIHLQGNIGPIVPKLREILQQMVALEIFEISKNRITAKAFLDVTETSIVHIIRRMDILLKVMFEDAANILRGKSSENRSKSQLIFQTDLEVNRLYFFGLKILTRALNSPEIARQISMSPVELGFTISLLEGIEKIADRVKKIADAVSEGKMRDSERAGLKGMLDRIRSNYEDVIKAYFKHEKRIAHRAIDAHHENKKMCYDFLQAYGGERHGKQQRNCNIPFAVEMLNQASSITEDVARVVLDISVVKE